MSSEPLTTPTDSTEPDASMEAAETPPQQPDAGLAVQLQYAAPSFVEQTQGDRVHLQAALARAGTQAAQFSAKINQPLLFRETLATLFGVVKSDYRYVPKDRAAYAAYCLMRRGQQHLGLFAAQQAYFDWLLLNDPLAFCILDSVISVHADGVTFEVFSRDESTYATLTLTLALFETENPATFGTTHIDFSDALMQGLSQIRSSRDTYLDISSCPANPVSGLAEADRALNKDLAESDTPPDTATEVELNVETAPALADARVIEKNIHVPASWIRGFLQVQSAAQLAQDCITLRAIDVYNALFELRMHADMKGKRRGLLIELVPKKPPTLILEPFGTIIQSQGQPYTGRQGKIIRLWGRRRLALLQRLLPFADTIEVRLLGQGMPSYWTVKGSDFEFTLALTGFTQKNWSQALNFDLLLPRHVDPHPDATVRVIQSLQHYQALSVTDIANATQLTLGQAQSALQQACQEGSVMYDAARGFYRYRPLHLNPEETSKLLYRSSAEQLAYDLNSRPGAVKDLQVNIIIPEGFEVSAHVYVAEDKRDYLPSLRLNTDGMVTKAQCTCHQFLQHQLALGPCSHLIVLRIVYSDYVAKQNDPNRPLNADQVPLQQMRLFSRRQHDDILYAQVSLKGKRLVIEQGLEDQPRRQQLAFNTVPQAYAAYLQKIQQFEVSGFIENTLG